MTKRDVKRYYPTPALEKGLDILELFAGTPEGLTVSEAARRLNRTVSEIFRMILCLEQRGYLAQSPNKERYHLTLRLFRLAQEHPPTKRLVTETLSDMHLLCYEPGRVFSQVNHLRGPRRHPRAVRFARVDGVLRQNGLESRPDACSDRPRHPRALERGRTGTS